MKKFILGLMLTLMASSAFAAYPKVHQGDSWVLGGASHHFNSDHYTYEGETHRVNEINWTVGYQHDDVRGVVFYNTYRKLSLAAMYSPKWNIAKDVDLGFRVGAATGYNDTPREMILAPIADVELAYHVTPSTQVVMGYGVANVMTFHVQVNL